VGRALVKPALQRRIIVEQAQHRCAQLGALGRQTLVFIGQGGALDQSFGLQDALQVLGDLRRLAFAQLHVQ
jgi:hypothetical protein